MKVLTLQDLHVDDSLALYWDATCDPQLDIERALEPFLQTLEEYSGEWMPEMVRGKRERQYSRAAIWEALEEQRTSFNTGCEIYRTTPPFASLTLSCGVQQSPRELRVGLYVPLTFFHEEERCRRFVELVRAWSSHYPVSYAQAHSGVDAELAGAPTYGRDEETTHRDGFDQIYEVCWLNVFGPQLVERVGRKRMLSTQAHQVEELPNGSVLLVSWPTAADFTREEARQAQARALVHMRPELDYNSVLRDLHERNAALLPVEPRFHPDVAPLLSRLVMDQAGIRQRQRRLAELNTYQPPEPDEWLPASAALLPDVLDTQAALEHYSLLAEHLVAMRHIEVPSLFEQTPESLIDLDFFFWLENFPETFERHNIDQWAVPAVGAYLGQVLVRYLGGEWLPRKKLEEAQVRVGRRAWLPFLRAHRYMRSSQSLLDFSLGQVYRVAERRRG
ncbi:MAG TPA: hypothetical protein VF815_46760 [Myxococcaceae bacterium]